MSKKCVQLAQNQSEKPVHLLPQYPPYSTAPRAHSKVSHSSATFVPTIHKLLSHVLHSHVEENNRGKNGVIQVLHTAYYYYY